jgi:hypothetical protein
MIGNHESSKLKCLALQAMLKTIHFLRRSDARRVVLDLSHIVSVKKQTLDITRRIFVGITE